MRALMLIVLIAPVLVSPAKTEESKFDWNACQGSVNLKIRIESCSRLINDPNISQEGRAFALFNRGHAWDLKRDFGHALADYTESIRLDPTNEHVYFYRGSVWVSKHENDRAIADYSEAIRLNPEFAEAYYKRSLIWRRKGSIVKARDDLSQALKIDPKILSSEK